MENNAKMVASYDISTADIGTDDISLDSNLIDVGNVDVSNEFTGEIVDTGNMGDYADGMDTPKAGISTQIILYIVIGVCAAVGIALGIIRGIKVAKK
jgi:hypothetical protein